MKPFTSQTKMVSLTPAQIDLVVSWLLDENVTYGEAVERVEANFGFAVTKQTIGNFWVRECVPRKLLRSAEAAKSVQSLTSSLKADWQGANSQLLGQRIFETLASPEVDLKTVSALGNVLEKVKARTLNEKKVKALLAAGKRREKQREKHLALAREKFEFDAVDAALRHAPVIRGIMVDDGLVAAEKRERVRRLLFPQAFGEVAG